MKENDSSLYISTFLLQNVFVTTKKVFDTLKTRNILTMSLHRSEKVYNLKRDIYIFKINIKVYL